MFENNSDSDVELKINNEYAKNYNKWRKKEELHKLKARYGEDNLDTDESSSDTSDDDEQGVEITEQIEKDFYKTLSYLKNKDPRIYDKNTKFFDTNQSETNQTNKKDKPMYIKDYERKVMLERDGKFSDSDDENEEKPERNRSPTYVEEQRQLKENLRKALENGDDNEADDEENWGGIFRARQKTEAEKAREEEEYRAWLAGQKDQIDDQAIVKELKPLKDYWDNPNLDEGEKFLKDYVLNKRYIDDHADYIPTYDEIVNESAPNLSDEEEIDKQEEFEHKYNFRFEEPDQEFIKRYPRTMENSLRKIDDKRKLQRTERKERKQKEKQEKIDDLRKLRELKRKEIEEKIEKLREITGNNDLKFDANDMETDFDPEEHDKKMQTLFNEEFYADQEDVKPEFPSDSDDDGDWNALDGDEPHCEDPNFNMDCDYAPDNVPNVKDDTQNTKKKRKRKSAFAQSLTEPKPEFDPNNKTYAEYLDEYYQLDCEDFIGDLPCRFKYRKVIPNDFGLTIEEILKAKDSELNRWASLKKVVKYRPDNVEKNEQLIYKNKAKNLELKRKILPSLFEDEPSCSTSGNVVEKGKRRRKAGRKEAVGMSDARLNAYGLNPKKFRNKLKYSKN